MNKYAPHVYVIPEDDADRQLADGFVNHHSVDYRRIKVMPLAGGWRNAIATFEDEYIHTLRGNQQAHVVMLIDFDNHVERRRSEIEESIPDDIKPRVFVVGCRDNPEAVKRAMNASLEEIGARLAKDCDVDATDHWNHEQFRHNDDERERLVQAVKKDLFRP